MLNSYCFFNTVGEWGGGERWHYDMALYLRSKGHRVMVITQPGAVLGERVKKEGISVFTIVLKNLSVLNPFVLLKLANVYRTHAIDTVVLNLSRDLKCGGISAKMAGVKNIIFRRGSDRSVRNYFINRFLYQKVVTGILTNSKATKSAILSKGVSLVNPDKIKVIPNGIDTQSFLDMPFEAFKRNKKSPIILGALGRLESQKNFEFLIPVALELKKRGVYFDLLIGGKGSQESMLKRAVEENGLRNNFQFLGFLENPKDLFMSSDIFLLPSLWEGFGYVIVEASLSELPVIAFDISSNSEVITEATGFLTAAHDVLAFCDKITYLYRNPEERKAMGKAGKNFVINNFESTQVFERIEGYLLGGC
ncbi:MAG: glycosyltransferase family 1 protein [Flavobacteriales bacterium TMED235]|nr:MAG: glycosyltransferase family 1 protein [Flavobacteriales bacterium TMED235]|tara:strand:- start:11644 stop:12735 length:1092 start_codon:yes stop_codon:yes gene_type:complete